MIYNKAEFIKIPPKRKNEIKLKVLEVLKESDITTLPTVLDYISNTYKIPICSYKKMIAGKLKIDVSKDGYTTINPFGVKNTYLVSFNEKNRITRCRWTVAHEFGHIFMGHFKETCNLKYNIKEREADYFAEQLLSPIAVVNSYGVKSLKDIIKLCNLSLEAVENRKDDLIRHRNYKSKYGLTKYDEMFLKQFNNMYYDEFASEFLYIA